VISFSSPIAITNLDYPESVAVGDFNGDGKLDMAVGSYGESEVYIYINSSTTGAISFDSAVGSGSVSDPREIAVGDLNGDGRPDFAVVEGDGALVYTYQNLWTNGTFGFGSFGLATPYATGSGSADSICVLAADIDGDGRPDLVVGNFSDTNIVFFQNISQY
jgi:hypothetical protein